MGDWEGCQHFIPLARSELIDRLCADPDLPEGERDLLRPFCELVTLACHLDYHNRLLELKRAYAPYDPDTDSTLLMRMTAEERQQRLNHLFSNFAWLLERAHFRHLGQGEIEPVLDSASDWGIRMDVDFSVFEHLALFARGDAVETRTRRRWTRLWKVEEAEVPIYRRLAVILKLRPHPRLRGQADTENVFLKVFKDIPKLDVMMLLPGARVHLSRFDRGRIGFPLLTGAALAVFNLMREVASTLEEVLASPNVVWGLAAGGLGYGYRSFYGYQQTKQRYHLTLTQSLYFQNLDSNAGVLTRLFDEAEEQDGRLALLAYYCLWRFAGADGWTSADLDASVELYLDRYADIVFVCPAGAALAQLRRLCLVEEAGGRCRAVPPARAIEALRGALLRSVPNVGERGASAPWSDVGTGG
jgi:hypothetical protein